MVTVGDIIGGGFRFLRQHIGALAVWALLYLAMNVAMVFLLRPVMQDMVAAQAVGGATDPALALAGAGRMFGIYILVGLAMLILYTAALRAAVRPEESRFAYLRLGMDEVRMVIVALIVGVAFMILYLLLALVTGLVSAAVLVASRDAAIPVIVLMALIVFGTLMFFYVRFSLVFSLTILRRKIVLGASWEVTKGRFWMLFLAYFVLTLIVAVASLGLLSVTMGPYIAEMARGGFAPQAVNAAQRLQMQNQFGAITVFMVLGWVASAILGVVWIGLSAGAVGTATIGLLDDEFTDIGAVYE